MQQSVVQPINSQRGMAARGDHGHGEFWSRRPFAYFHASKANKKLTHRHERRVLQKQEIRFWEEDERLSFEADMKELSSYFEYEEDAYDEDFDFFDVGGSDDAYYARTRTRQLDNFLAHNEPYYSGCPICGPLGCILD